MANESDVHVATEEAPIITRYEPGFRRIYAQGSLVHNEEDDPHVVSIAFWSARHRKIPMEENGSATGYQLEGETVMTWEAAERLHRLLGKWLSERRPRKT